VRRTRPTLPSTDGASAEQQSVGSWTFGSGAAAPVRPNVCRGTRSSTGGGDEERSEWTDIRRDRRRREPAAATATAGRAGQRPGDRDDPRGRPVRRLDRRADGRAGSFRRQGVGGVRRRAGGAGGADVPHEVRVGRRRHGDHVRRRRDRSGVRHLVGRAAPLDPRGQRRRRGARGDRRHASHVRRSRQGGTELS
jgi:hypothetical protein